MHYKKIIIFSIIFFGALFFTKASLAAVTLPWSTTYNCADWNQYSDTLNCDGLGKSGGWTACGYYEQITAGANYSGGGGGKGQRHWIGDGVDTCSGGTSISFSSQSEIWVRFYFRYQSGFKWSSISYNKLLYFNNVCIPELHGWDVINIYGGNANHDSTTGGWDTFYKNGAIDPATGHHMSDGSWHYMEFHLAISGGVGEAWVDGVKYLSVTGINYGSNFTSFHFPSNQRSANNGGCYYLDIDDVAISNTGYIGPIPTGPDTTPPAAPTGLTVI